MLTSEVLFLIKAYDHVLTAVYLTGFKYIFNFFGKMSFITRYSFHWAKLYLRFFITFKFQFSQTEAE